MEINKMAPITRSLTTKQLRSSKMIVCLPCHISRPFMRKSVIAKIAPRVVQSNLKRLKSSINRILVTDDEVHDDPLFHSIVEEELKRRNLSVTYTQVVEVEKLRRTIRQKLGHFWQEFLSNARDYENLGTGHASGCDLINHKRKLIVELKNKHCTMNASAYLGVNMKMLSYLKKHRGYTGVIGFINDRTDEGRDIVNRFGIRELGGMKLMQFMFEGEEYIPCIHDLKRLYKDV